MPTVKSPRVATILIDGTRYLGQFELGTDEERMDFKVSEPDLSWVFTDTHKHLHAFDSFSGELPTLRKISARVMCEGDCEAEGCEGFFEEFRFFCRICEERVHPEWKVVTRNQKVSELHWWRATARGPIIMPGAHVSVVIQQEGMADRFGVAWVTGADIDFSEKKAEITLDGSGRLGFRPAVKSTKGGQS